MDSASNRDGDEREQRTGGESRAERRYSRRTVLGGVGAAGVAALSGCASSPSGGTSETEGGGGGTTGSATGANDGGTAAEGQSGKAFTATLPITNPDLNFNEFNFAAYSWDLTGMLFDPLAKWNPDKGEYVPVLLESWEFGDKSLTLDIRDGYTWHSGSPLTAEDAVKSLRLAKNMQWSVSEYAKKIEKTGERSLRIDLKSQTNKHVIEHELLGGTWINKPPHVYGKWMEQFRKASSEEERSTIREELSNLKITEPFGYGPLAIENINAQRIEMRTFDDHPAGDKLDFDRYTVEFIGTNQKVWQAMRADKVDGVPGVFAPEQVVQELPDHWVQQKHPSYGGFGLAFNHDHPAFGKRPVRKAVAHVIDRKMVATNSGAATKKPVDMVTGAAPRANEKWFADESKAFTDYETDIERAAELMRKAGYEKRNGRWAGPNGPLTPSIIAPAGTTDWVTAAKTVSNQLRSFGIAAELSTSEHATYSSQYDKGNFDLAATRWGSGPYPLFAYQGQFKKEEREKIGYPATVTVPAMGSSGKTTVNIPELMKTINRSNEKDEKHLTRLAWTWNQDLPVLPIQSKLDQTFITTDDWNVPAKDAAVMSIDDPPTYLPKVGRLRRE